MSYEEATPEIDLFHEVLDQPPEMRRAFIASRHADAPERQARLERLLAAHERAEQAPQTANLDAIPDRIGPYRVIELLGEGGMGLVYSAEQLEPIRRRVAIKVIKLGMATQDVISRFEAERQALAMLDHPGVARVFDAGSTDSGRPYFVMELVRGISITDYCKTHDLGTQDKLQLFARVCDAVNHAHQKGIIHRDIKPSNVLVGLQDSVPAPKIIDFGVMKATSARLSERTVFTEHGQLIGTPEYMSPEQAEMSGLDVDTRTDVYSLGVMLYELLTGDLPFDSKALRAGGYSNIQRVIREVQPERPSARLRDKSAARALRGDLDRVVMCAIAKDRTHRYESASALRDDIKRFLADIPVHAGQPGALYRFTKLVKRQRYWALALLVIALASATGIAGLWFGLKDAREAEALAARRAENAHKASAFLQKVLFHVDPEFGGGKLSLLEVLGIASRSVDKDLGGHPEVEASVRESIGVAYRRLSMFDEAEPHLRRSLELRREQLGEDSLQAARSYVAMADLRFEHEGSVDEPLEYLRRARRIFIEHGFAGTQAEGWLALDIGLVAYGGDRLTEAMAAFETSQRLIGAARGDNDPDVSRGRRGLALVQLQRGNLTEAERLARQAVTLCEGEGAVYIGARAKLVLTRVRAAAGDVESARRLLDEARAQFERTVDPMHIRMAEVDALDSEVALGAGQAAEALRLAERCAKVRRSLLHPRHWAHVEAELLRQRARLAMGHVESADAALRGLAERAQQDLGADHRVTVQVARARLEAARAQGDDRLVKVRELRLRQLETTRAARIGK